MFHYTAETTASVQNAIAALETSLKEEQFGVLWQFNLREKLKEKGFDFEREYVVLEVCNPAEANRVINENVLAGYFFHVKLSFMKRTGRPKSACRNRPHS